MSNGSSERKKVGMLVPPPILLLGLAVLGVAVHWLWFGGFAVSLPGIALGAVVMLAALALVAVCWRRFERAGTPVRPVSPVTTIVSTGPYRFSRNPMYLGMTGLLLGLGILLGSWVLFAAAAIFVAVVHVGVVLPEERYLDALHGERYRRYKQVVRRWL